MMDVTPVQIKSFYLFIFKSNLKYNAPPSFTVGFQSGSPGSCSIRICARTLKFSLACLFHQGNCHQLTSNICELMWIKSQNVWQHLQRNEAFVRGSAVFLSLQSQVCRCLWWWFIFEADQPSPVHSEEWVSEGTGLINQSLTKLQFKGSALFTSSLDPSARLLHS